MLKKVMTIILALAMVLSMAACGQGKDSSTEANASKTEKAAEEKVELRLQTPEVFAVGYLDALYDLIKRFETENPNIKINVEELNWDGIGDKLESAMMTGTTPDIYIDGTARTAKLPSTGLVVDLSDVINGLDNWVESTISIGRVDGKNYLVPMTQMPPTVLGINATLAKQYGVYDMLPKDRISWTWSDFMAFLEACGEKSIADGVYPIGFYAGSQSSDIAYYSMMLCAGAEILSEDHKSSAVNNEAAISVLTYLKELSDKGLVYPGAATMTDEEESALYYSGKTVVSFSQNGALTTIPVVNEMKKEGMIAEVPELEAYAYPTLNGSQTRNATWGANCIAVFENEGNEAKINAAKKFISFMMNDLSFSEALWLAGPSYAPTRDMGQKLKSDDAQMLREAEINIKLGEFNTSSFGILEPYWAEIRQHFYPELQSMLNGNKTPSEVIANFDASINQIIASY